MKQIFFPLLLLIGAILSHSCTQKSQFENRDDENDIVRLNESHFVTLKEALHIADLQMNPYAKGAVISDFLELKNYGAKTELYIIDYPHSGYIIISGDDRLIPILAYSEKSHFPLCDSIVPWGVTDWLNSACRLVDSIRNTDMKQSISTRYNWESAMSGKNPIFKPVFEATKTDYSSIVWEYGQDLDQDDCGWDGYIIGEFYTYVPQLLSTLWGQEDGYNEFLPYAGCSSTINGKYLVGCVAVAVGQVMLENRYPGNFDWDAIYNSGFAFGTATNAFLRDIGLPGNLNIIYGCNSSYAYASDAVSYLSSVGYTYTTLTSTISASTILNNLRYGYPVILAGGGHMWVCDGIKSYNSVVCFAAGGSYDYRYEFNSNKQYLLMNWGWYGDYNGWYLSFSPGSYNFNSNKKLIYNIKH